MVIVEPFEQQPCKPMEVTPGYKSSISRSKALFGFDMPFHERRGARNFYLFFYYKIIKNIIKMLLFGKKII